MDKLAIAREVLSGIAMTSDEARTLNSILDRLTPAPETEVDEATKVTRRVRAAHYADESYLEPDDEEGFGSFIAVKNVIREVLAAKNAERDGLTDRLKDAWADITNLRSERATLRAENERLKDTIADLGVDLDEWQRCERAAGNIPSPKAAERNPAEPERRLSSEVATALPEKSCAPLTSRSSDGSGVEVQQVDREWMRRFLTHFDRWEIGEPAHDNATQAV